MRKYNNPRLLNTVVSGTGMQHPVKPHVIVSDTVSEFVKGDLMDANAISELVDQKIGSVEGSTEANVTELRLALTEEAAARTSADQTLDERITDLSTSIPLAISDGIAQVVAGADADYDTLKEISDYIKSDKTGAAQLSTAINNNTTAIDNESTRAQAKEAELEAVIDTKAAQSTTYTKAEVDTLVNSVDVSEQLANYYTKSEIDNAGYLTEHQDISNKADKSELFSGDYNDLTNKPTIPTVPTNVSEFTNDAGYITQHQDISGKANTSDLAAVATSGSYNDLDDKPTIPTVLTNVSSFTNDANYQTQQLVDDRFTALINAAPAALDTLGEIATKLADNDDAVSAIVTSISSEVDAREAADTAITTNITELASTVSANNTAINNKVDALETSLEDRISDVEDAMPTKVSDLANDNGDILSDPKWLTIYDGNGTCQQTGPYHYGYVTSGFTLAEGDVYKVTINNNEYIKTAYLNGLTNMPTVSDGNFAWPYTVGYSMFTDNWLIHKSSTSGDCIICIYSEDGSLSGQTVTVKIEKLITNKIDAKYIPDIYAQKTDLLEQLLSDWNETDTSSKAYIQNKPVIPTVPTNVSAFQNDARYVSSPEFDANGHEYVEIGGIKWATMNVGATSAEGDGLYFQWGDTQGYTKSLVGTGTGQKRFNWASYKYSSDDSGSVESFTKYNTTDGLTTLDISDDAVRANWGGSWRMPTEEEVNTLKNSTNREYTTVNGVTGFLLTDKSDNTKLIFMPLAGWINDTTTGGNNSVSYTWVNGSYGANYNYGGMSLSIVKQTNSVNFNPSYPMPRSYGLLIRGVLESTTEAASLSSVAFSGSYNDLTDKPTIPTVPTNVSAFQNDAGYITQHQSLGNYYTKTEVDSSQQAQNTEISSKADKSTTYTKTEVDNLITPKANASDVYSKTEADSTFIKDHLSLAEYAKKTELVDAYSKTETDELLANKANLADLAAANSHAYVDLGLPSGTLWATMNVGATSETDYGNYYMYGKGSETYVNPNTRYLGTEVPLATSADTATQEWGGAWHMPTSAQMNELKANTTYQWVTDYKGSGINGGLFTATNGKCVFFPAAGQWYAGSQGYVGEGCNFWSSSPSGNKNAYCMNLTSYNKLITPSYDRMYGFSVRGVLDSKQLHRVAFSGDYNDLANKPVIPTVWTGTQAEYDAITSPSASTIYFIKG